jgi:sec-independent protein translocase protein TatA
LQRLVRVLERDTIEAQTSRSTRPCEFGGVSGSIGPTLAKRSEEDYRVDMLLGFLAPAEIAVIVLIVLLIFGPSKLPQLGKSVGAMLRGFKKEMKSMDEDEPEASKDTALPRGKSGEIDVTPTGNAEKKTTT